MRSYLQGTDVLGATSAGRAVLIKVRDVPTLVRAQGGAAGALAQEFLPDTVEAKVYSEMAAEMKRGLKEKGVDADVSVVAPVGYKPAPQPDFTRGIMIGGGVVAALASIVYAVWGKR